MKKKKIWKCILPLVGVSLIVTSAIIRQAIVNSNNVLNHNINDNINNKLVELANNELVNEDNESDNPNISNISPRIDNEIPSLNNDINWDEYEFVANGLYVGSNKQDNILPENGLFVMFPNIVKTNSSEKKSVNLLDFLFLNDNLDSACSKRYDQIFNWYNIQSYPSMNINKNEFNGGASFDTSYLQGVKFKSFEYNKSRNKFQVTTALACQFYNTSSKEISPTQLQTDIVIELDPPFWFDSNWSTSEVELQELFQAKIEENNGIVLKALEFVEIASNFFTQKIQEMYVNIKKIPTKFLSYSHSSRQRLEQYKPIIKVNKDLKWFMKDSEYFKLADIFNGNNYLYILTNHPLKIKETSTLNSVNAQTIGEFVPQFKNLSANEVLKLWEQDQNDKLFTDFISEVNKMYTCYDTTTFEYYNDVLVRHIFINAPLEKAQKITIKNIESITGPNSYNSLKFTFNVANFAPELSTTVTNFKTDIVTSLIKTTIDATDPEFKTIFGENNKGFTIDFDKDISNEQTQLKKYINTHISEFFGDTHGVSVVVNDVVIIVDTSANNATATITYNELNENGVCNENITNTIMILLKPTPGTDTSPEANNPLVGIEKFLQNKVDNSDGIFPNEKQLKNWVSDYLNTIKDELPNACIPNEKVFTYNNISIDSIKINKEQNPIHLSSGAISTTNVNTILTFNEFNINVKETKPINIQADNLINKYTSSYIIEQFKQNHHDPLIINTLLTWINNNLNNIFIPLPSEAIVTSINNISNSNDNNSIDVSVTLSKAYTTSEGIASNKDFSFAITNFNDHAKETLYIKKEISYTNDLFKTIFGSNNKGFTIDFEKVIANNTNILIQYMNSHIDEFFDKQSEPIKISVSKQSEATISDNIYTLNICYSGYNADGIYQLDIPETFTIHLRPLPNIDDNSSDINNPFNKWNEFLENKNRENNNVSPSIEQLKQWAASYLNIVEVRNNLPNSIIPSSGQFSASDIIINSSEINKTSSPIIIAADAIKTNTDPALSFPNASIEVNVTKAKNIAASVDIASYTPSYILSIWNSNPQDDIFKKILNFINEQKLTIFDALPSRATVTSIANITPSDAIGSLNFEVVLSQAYTSMDGIVSDYHISFEITNLNSDAKQTIQLLTNIKYTDALFKEIFGSNNKGFAIDFKKELNPNVTTLIQYMNAHIDTFFDKKNEDIQIIVANPSNQDVIDNTMIVNFTFSGYDATGNYVTNNEGTFSIALKPTPNINDPESNIDLLNGLKEFLQNKYDYNNGIFPEDDLLKEWVAEYLNTKKDELPNACIPGGINGSFSTINIAIDTSKIEHVNKTIMLAAGAISTTNVNNTLTFPEISILIKETIAHNIRASGDIANYTTTYILSLWTNNQSDLLFTETFLTWINKNKTSIFSDLIPEATVKSITAIAAGSTDLNLSFTVVLSKAYTSNSGIVNDHSLTFEITDFSAKGKQTIQTKTTLNYREDIFKSIFGNDNKGFAIDFKNNIDDNVIILIDYINKHTNEFFDKQNENFQIVVINPNNYHIDKTTFTIDFDYNGYDVNGQYIDNNKGSLNIELRETYDANNPTNNPFSQLENFIQDKINKNEGIIQDETTLKNWIKEYLDLANVQLNLPNEYIPSNIDNIVIDKSKIILTNNPVAVQAGAISIIANSENEPTLSLPGFNVKVQITKLIEEQFNVVDSSLANLIPDQIIADQNNLDSLSLSTIKQWLNNNRNKIFIEAPADAIITIVPNTFNKQTINTISFTIQISAIYTLDGIVTATEDPVKTRFKISLTGFDTTIREPTVLIKKDINFKEGIFSEIWGDNDKGFAVDWAHLSKDQLLKKQDQLKFYINNKDPNHELFFKGFRNIEGDIITSKTITFDFKEIKNEYFVYAKFTYQGINDKNILIQNKEAIIKIKLQSCNSDALNMEHFWKDVQDEIQNWVNQNPNHEPTKNVLETIVNKVLNKPQDSNKPNGPKNRDLLPNLYNPPNIVIKPQKISIKNGIVSLLPEAITLSSRTPNVPSIQGCWEPMGDITSPDWKFQYVNIEIEKKEDNTWWIWIIVAGSITIILIFVIIFYIKKSRSDNNVSI